MEQREWDQQKNNIFMKIVKNQFNFLISDSKSFVIYQSRIYFIKKNTEDLPCRAKLPIPAPAGV